MSDKDKKILIVEDDKFLAKMLGRMLESHNYEVVHAQNGKEGLVKAAGGVDLVLLDIMLPDMDGFDLLETLKSNQSTKKAPVIIMSNLGQAEDKQQGKALGAKNYIVKSDISLDEVVKKVRELLAEK